MARRMPLSLKVPGDLSERLEYTSNNAATVEAIVKYRFQNVQTSHVPWIDPAVSKATAMVFLDLLSLFRSDGIVKSMVT